jgi:hypothetical protein
MIDRSSICLVDSTFNADMSNSRYSTNGTYPFLLPDHSCGSCHPEAIRNDAMNILLLHLPSLHHDDILHDEHCIGQFSDHSLHAMLSSSEQWVESLRCGDPAFPC